MKRPTSTFLISALALLISSVSYAKHYCKVGQVTIIPTTPTVILNSPSPRTVDFILKRRNPSVACDFWIGFTKGQAATYDRKLFSGPMTIDYNIYKDQMTVPVSLKSYPDAVSANEVINGSFFKGGTKPNEMSFSFVVKPNPSTASAFDIKPPGTYTDTVQIKFFADQFPSPNVPLEVASANQTFVWNVDAFALVSLLDTGMPYTDPPITVKSLQFGDLVAGQNLNFDLVLLYNSGFKITFTSENGSKLKHALRDSFVPYTMTLNGAPLQLSASTPSTIASGSGQSPSAPLGHRFDVGVQIDSTSGAWAGIYSDSINIVVTSL